MGLNVCGLNGKINNGALYEYINEFDICCFSETKSRKGVAINDYTVFNMDTKPKKSEKNWLPGYHGLQVYISDRIANKCSAIYNKDFLCKSALWINISDQFILGSLYVPCQNSKHHYNDYFEDLASDIDLIKESLDLPFLLIGDFNSRTGTLNEIMILESDDNIFDETYFKYRDYIDILKHLNLPVNRVSKDKTNNNNGRALIELCKCKELCILNGRIGKDKGIGNTTCDDKSVIDYAICTPDLLSKVSDFQIDQFDPLFSDKHKPINVHLNLAKSFHSKSYTVVNNDDINNSVNNDNFKSNWDKQKANDYLNNFEMDKINELSNKLGALNHNEATAHTINGISDSFKDIFIQPAKNTEMHKQITTYTKNKNTKINQPWFNAICKESLKKFKNFKKTLPNPPSHLNKLQLKKQANKHKQILRKEKSKYDKEFNDHLLDLKKSNSRTFWKIINKDRKKTKTGEISQDNLFQHFSELTKSNSNPSTSSNVNIPVNQPETSNESINTSFTLDEVTKHIYLLKNNKSPGVDNILNEFIKHCPKELIVLIVKFFNIILESGIVPEDWTIGIIKPMYKNKGDINDVNNYRGITLLSCMGKLFTSILNSRLYTYLTSENILGNEQAGFRPKHSTLDHIFALHILTKFYIDQKKPLFCAFVDYSKAFDFIDRTYMWQKLLTSNINGKVFNVIKNIYENAKSQVSFKNTLTSQFPCQVGVRQGENLSPLLFAIYLNDFDTFLSEKYDGLTKVSESITNELQIYLRIFCLLYADDTLVLAETDKDLQKALDCLYEYCNKWALNVNLDKTKIIVFAPGRRRKFAPFKFGDNTVDIVDDYVYLGTKFNFNGKFEKAKAKQALQAKKASYSLISRIRTLNLTFEVSIELVEKLIVPILLYGSEIWGYEDPKHLQITLNNIMRRLLKLHKTTPICMINGETGLKEISEYIDNRMINFWGNIATGDENKVSSILYKWVKILHDRDIKRSVWIDKVKTTLTNIDMSYLFDDITSDHKNWLKNNAKTRLESIYAERWSESVFNNSSCTNYRAMTLVKKAQNYILKLPKRYAYALAKFKCVNHHMPNVTGRYLDIPYAERICTLCQIYDIGDEFHYLFICENFATERTRYIKRYYYNPPSMYKMTQLFESSDFQEMLNLAKFAEIVINRFKSR